MRTIECRACRHTVVSRCRPRAQPRRLAKTLTDLLRCRVPLQLAPMGGVSISAQLPLAVARAGGHAVYPGLLHTAETLAPRYPRWDDFQKVRAELDPKGVFENAYVRRVLGPVAS